MKKWLGALSALTLTVTSVTNIVAITYNDSYNKEERELIQFYVEATAYALRSAILYDVNSIDDSFVSPYFTQQRISNEFNKLLTKKHGAAIDKSSIMSQLYTTTFGIHDYSFRKELKMEVKTGTNLDEFLKGNEVAVHGPDVKTSNLITLLSGASKTIFGSGINNQTIALILSFLKQDFVQQAIIGEDVMNIVNKIGDVLNFEEGSRTDQAVNKVLDGLTEKNVGLNDETFVDVLSQNNNGLFKSLLVFVYQQTIRSEEEIDFNKVFFDKLNGKDDARLEASDEYDLVEAIGDVLKWVNGFGRYVSQFNEYRVNNNNNQGANHLFDSKKTNRQILGEVLTKKYKPSEADSTDPTWFKMQTGDRIDYYNIINFKDIFANILYYLVPNNNDPNGINLRKLFFIIFGNTDNGTVNPLVNDLITRGGASYYIGELVQKILGDLDVEEIPALKYIKTFIGSNAKTFNGFVGDLIYWTLLKIINNESLSGILMMVELVNGLAGDSLPENIKVLLNEIVAYFRGNVGNRMIQHPFNELYKGTVIPDLLKIIDGTVEADLTKYFEIKNIRTLFTMHFGELLAIFGVEQLPDIIYDLNYSSLSDYFNDLATRYQLIIEDDENKPVIQPFKKVYLDNFLNTADLENFIKNITAQNSGVKNEEGKQLGLVSPLYYSIIGGNRELDENEEDDKVIIDQLKGLVVERQEVEQPTSMLLEEVPNKPGFYRVNQSAINLLFGLNSKTLKFIPETALYNLSRLYGQNYDLAEFELNKHLINDPRLGRNQQFGGMRNAMTGFFTNLVAFFSETTNNSIRLVIRDQYSQYLDKKNFTMKNVNAVGFSFNKTPRGQKLEYDLVYKDPDSKREFTYHVYLTKGFYENYQPDSPKDPRGFMVRKFIRQN